MSDYFEPWLQFKNAIVRQLAFAIASPNLLRSTPHELQMQHPFSWHSDQVWKQHYENYLPRLYALDLNPEPLIRFFNQLKSTRLGLRFEYLIWFWLLDKDYHPYQLLAHSLQVIEGKTTLGELDFLIYNQETKHTEHWEVALKYYLAEQNTQLYHWYGLNRQDTLYRKLQHFAQQQFKFTMALQMQIDQRFAVMKGQLFLPLFHTTHNLPVWLNTSRRLGYWGTQIFAQNHFRIARSQWLCLDNEQGQQDAVLWCDGLYYNRDTDTPYMFRQVEYQNPLLWQQFAKQSLHP